MVIWRSYPAGTNRPMAADKCMSGIWRPGLSSGRWLRWCAVSVLMRSSRAELTGGTSMVCGSTSCKSLAAVLLLQHTRANLGPRT